MRNSSGLCDADERHELFDVALIRTSRLAVVNIRKPLTSVGTSRRAHISGIPGAVASDDSPEARGALSRNDSIKPRMNRMNTDEQIDRIVFGDRKLFTEW
jgi:hypothetical protein